MILINHLKIDRVYVFVNKYIYSIYQNGNPYPIDLTEGKISVKGYFEVSDDDLLTHLFNNQGRSDYTIKSYMGTRQYCEIENVAITKTSSNYNTIKIKFIARRLLYI